MKPFSFVLAILLVLALMLALRAGRKATAASSAAQAVSDTLKREAAAVAAKFPYPIRALAGKDALAALEAARASAAKGTRPVLIGGEQALVSIAELMEMDGPVDAKAILAKAARLDPAQWAADQERRQGTALADLYKDDGTHPDAMKSLVSITDILSGAPLQTVYLAEIPAEQAWQIPAYLKLGGWNDCPESAVHVALQKRWAERYGAQLVALGSDIMEFEVDRPPRTFEEALPLAKEQFLYCEDIVSQGVNSVPALARALVGARYWYFWWD